MVTRFLILSLLSLSSLSFPLSGLSLSLSISYFVCGWGSLFDGADPYGAYRSAYTHGPGSGPSSLVDGSGQATGKS